MSRRQKIAGMVLAAIVAAFVLVSWTLHGMAKEDEKHARFYNTGKTINAFLSSYCKGIEAAVAESDPAHTTAFYSQRYRSPARGSWGWDAEVLEAGAAVSARLRDGEAEFTPAEIAAETAEYYAGIESLDKTICKIDLISEVELEKSAVLTVKIILDGTGTSGRFFQDRHIVRWHLANEAGRASGATQAGAAGAGADAAGAAADAAAYDWKIVRDELIHGVRVAGDRGGLVEIDAVAAGIDFEHRRDPNLDMKRYGRELKFAVIQHASGGISAADYDSDGRPDLLFLDGERIRLYRNVSAAGAGGAAGEPSSAEVPSAGNPSAGNPSAGDPPAGDSAPVGDLRFVDVTAAAGLDGIGRTHVGIFADFDNDGDRDLFLGRYLVPNKLFLNDGAGVFTDASAEMGIDLAVPATSATLLDFDHDGFVDLYLGVNGNAFEALPRLPFFAQNGQPNRLLRNDGGSRFVDVTSESGTGDVGWTLAVAAGDVDGDGWSDLGVANDFGRKNLYRNNGDGTFSEVAKEAGVLDFSGGMGLTFGDFDDDGAVDLYTSNINSNQRWFGEDRTVSQYIRNVARTRWMLTDFLEYWKLYRLVGNDWVELGQQIGEGNSLFRNRGDGTFEELKDSRTARAGWGWTVAFFDVDNDADLDLYAANGWISNTPGTDL